MKFYQQHAIITGGSSGIGLAIAKHLAKEGANVSIIARNPVKLEVAKAEIEAVRTASTQSIFAISADVSDRLQIEKALQTAIAQVSYPDILITCAGMAYPDYFQKLPIEVFEKTMAVNYFGSLYSIRAVLPSMEKQQRGQIVLICSGAGLIGLYGYTAYSPSKFALRGLAESLRGELKPLGIQVSIVYPPDTDTPQLEAENKTKPSETKEISGTAKILSAEAVAYEIIKGLQNQSFIITPGLEMTLLGRLHSLLAPILNWHFDRIVAKIKVKG